MLKALIPSSFQLVQHQVVAVLDSSQEELLLIREMSKYWGQEEVWGYVI
jgi:hypothetical protein